MNSAPIEVEELGLMPKTAEILRANHINTLDDLLLLDSASLSELEGLSEHRAAKVRECIEKYREIELGKTQYATPNEQEEPNRDRSVSEYLKEQKIKSRNIEIFAKYYTNSGVTLEDIAEEYSVTRERVRQICNKCLVEIRNGLSTQQIDSNILETIELAAEEKTEINMVNVSDELLGKTGLVRIIALIYWDEFEIIKSSKLNGEWLTKREEDVKNTIDRLSKTLQERETPMLIEDVLTIFSINEDMLLSIKNIIEKDGYVTLSTNTFVTGRMPRIKNFLLKIGRPASILEISEGTGLTINQVRGAVSDKHEFENVGKSIYDSADASYAELTPSELARNILLAENRALSVSQIVKYVQRYDCSDLSERDILIDLFSGEEKTVRYLDDYVLLNEWGAEKIEAPARRNFSVDLRTAVEKVIPEMDYIFDADQIAEGIKKKYGDSASSNINSIRAYLCALAKEDVIIEVGKHSG